MGTTISPWETNTDLQDMFGGLAGTTTQLPGTYGDSGFTSDYSPNNSFMNSAKSAFGDFDLGGLVDGLSGLASMWMNYDALQSQKASARDAHNANRDMYNNKLARAKDVSRSIYGRSSPDSRTTVASSTV